MVTKTLAAYQLGRADSYKQLFTDGTSWRQTAIQNAVVGILTDGGFKMVTLSSGILVENETAECLTAGLQATFPSPKNGLFLVLGYEPLIFDLNHT